MTTMPETTYTIEQNWALEYYAKVAARLPASDHQSYWSEEATEGGYDSAEDAAQSHWDNAHDTLAEHGLTTTDADNWVRDNS